VQISGEVPYATEQGIKSADQGAKSPQQAGTRDAEDENVLNEEVATNFTRRIRVGVGGWVYAEWRGVFYPPGLPQARELEWASRRLTAIEINGTFYRTQSLASFRRWRDETPADFVFSLKGPRFATHRPDLAEAGPAIDRFLTSGVLELGDKLGPILWQFPGVPGDEGAFGAFLELLPSQIDGRTLRHAVELRGRKAPTTSLMDLLRPHKVALVVGDDRPDWETTADFVYAHLRRCAADEPAGYPPEALDGWAARLRERVAQNACDCFVYFISGAKIRAPAAAQALLERLRAG
jgi:uncharacterized protein YecE (DUF72 family)